MWAIGSREPRETLERFRDDFDISLPILYDGDGSVYGEYQGFQAFPTGAYPQQWLVGTDGRIVAYANRHEPDAMAALIEAELAE